MDAKLEETKEKIGRNYRKIMEFRVSTEKAHADFEMLKINPVKVQDVSVNLLRVELARFDEKISWSTYRK